MSFEIKCRTNGIHFVEFTDENGDRKRISLGTRDPKAAEILGREKYIAYFSGGAVESEGGQATRKTTFTLGDAIDRMKKDDWSPDVCASWVTIWSDCSIILRQIGDIELADLQYDHLLRFAEQCKVEGLAPGTIKKRLSRIRTILINAATKWRNPKTKLPYITYVPAFPKLESPKPRKMELSEEDERRVYEYCDKRMHSSNRGQQWWLFKQFIMWQIDTGMRKSETLGKTMADIRGDVVILHATETKTNAAREVPLTTRLQKMVGIFKSMEITGCLFSGLTSGKIFEMWDECRSELGLGDVTIHDLRHTRGQRLVDSGVPIEVVADLLGHKDISITARVYTFRKIETLRKWTDHAEAVA